MSTGNRRVDRILDAARASGHVVTASTNVESCWTVRPEPDQGYSITVYGGPNNAAQVMADLPGRAEWEQITQRHALSLLTTGGLIVPDELYTTPTTTQEGTTR